LTGKALDVANIAFLSELSHAHNSFQIIIRKVNESLSQCSVIAVLSDIAISDIYDKRPRCPETCLPVPKITLSNELIFQSSYANLFDLHKDMPITCSFTLDMIHRRRQKAENLKTSKRQDVSLFLKELFFRKIYECYEFVKIPKRLYHHNINSMRLESEHLPRRKVKALIIWIGSTGNIQLLLDQLQVLQGQPNAGMDAVVAWAATDEIYNCNENTTQCFGGNGKYKYLPHSAMNVNKFGWKCAQRRPLRALAHTLLLFDPAFAVILDDDTYLNYPHLIETFGSYLFNDMLKEPIYMGEFLGKTGVNGHLSTEGIFAGGAGYLLGQRLLQILHSKQIRHFGFEFVGEDSIKKDLSDRYRSDQQVRHLSLLSEGMSTVCNGVPLSKLLKANDSKTPFLSDALAEKQQMFIPIPVRLIEFCSNLMANEHACHHR